MSYQVVQVDPNVFRAYDIRGLVDEQLTENTYYTLGLSIGLSLLKLERSCVVLGRDGRLSSERFARALSYGIRSCGIQVIVLGVTTTPMMYFATHTSLTDCGVMITGSHNPASYNGIKMVFCGKTLVQEDIQVLQHQIQTHQVEPYVLNAQLAEERQYDIFPQYQARIVSDIQLQRPFKVVVDAGNGVAGPFAPQVLEAIGCEVISLYCDVDGHFPHHHPDPTIEKNLMDLRQQVLHHQADVGFGFDGDADRLGVLTNTGEMIWPDRLMMYYAQDILKNYSNPTIVFDVKCTKALKQHIESLGGRAYMCPTGHSIVKGVMRQYNAPLAGEMSGHIFFKDRWFGFDDALYSACRLLELMSQHTISLHDQFLNIPNLMSTPELKIPVADGIKFDLMQQISDSFDFADGERILIDGVRIEFPEGWGLIRASNTTPCLVARFEAENQAAMDKIQLLFKQSLQTLDHSLMIPF
jgi:phosphomannomutase/phosphoglucomutase